MSHAVVVVAAPQLLPAGLGLGAAAATMGVAALAGYGSYIAIRQLHRDYQEAVAEFHARTDADMASRLAFAGRTQAAMSAAVATADQTKVRAAENATIRFLKERVASLTDRIPQLPTPDPDFAAQCAALQRAIEDSPADALTHLEQYRRLAEKLTAAAQTGSSTALDAELAALREEIGGALLASEESAATRAQLLAQLEALEGIARRQPRMAAQGLALLHQRLQRELARVAQQQQERARAAEAVRMLVGDTLAKLHAVSRQTALPALQQQATALLPRFAELLVRATAEDLGELQQFAAQAGALFAECETMLEEQTIAAYLGDQVTDVLLSMGYDVSQVAPASDAGQRAVVAAVDDRVGLEFHINGKGQVGTELVAFSEAAADAGQEMQEPGCQIIDQVLEALRARECQIRERFRSSLVDGERLRIVEQPEQAAPQRAAAAPKQMRVDEP